MDAQEIWHDIHYRAGNVIACLLTLMGLSPYYEKNSVSQKLVFDDDFFSDIRKINGRYIDDWKVALILQFRQPNWVWELPSFKWLGKYRNSESTAMNLSSAIWYVSGFYRLILKLWFLHDDKGNRFVLYAEHPKTLMGRDPLNTSLSRAERHGFPRSAFEPAA